MKKNQVTIMVLSLAAVFLSGCREQETQSLQTLECSEETVQEQEDQEEQQENGEQEMVAVYVCGAVCAPGVYELPAESRIFQAVELAGGFAENASVDSVNQAQYVSDEMQIYIPTTEEASQGEMQGTADTGQESGKINLNTATKEELMTLSGIGEAKANSILQYRTENGAFQNIEEIMEIDGIKEGVFQKIKEQITV